MRGIKEAENYNDFLFKVEDDITYGFWIIYWVFVNRMKDINFFLNTNDADTNDHFHKNFEFWSNNMLGWG